MNISRRALLGGALAAPAALALTPATSAFAAVPIRYGSWTDGMDANPSLLDATASKVGRSLSIASVFRGAGDDPYWPYTCDYTMGVRAGRILLVSWSTQDYGNFAWWASGSGDAAATAVAKRLAAYGGTVVLRPWAEMNGDWVDFQPTSGTAKPKGGTPAQFIAAWRRLVNVMRPLAPKVKFCFNPTTDTYTGTTDIRTIYPGSAYVDIHGLDGYNWGTGGIFTWTSFANIYTTQYNRLVGLSSTKPVWVCEVSSADPASAGYGPVVTAPAGASKGSWWVDAHTALRPETGAFGKVQAVVFFDANKERDWRVDSSTGALTGLKTAMASPPMRSSLII